MTVVERTREFGMLRTLGMTRSQVLNIQGIFGAQPGHHLLEVLSGLAVGLIQEEPHFQHNFQLLAGIDLMTGRARQAAQTR